MKMDDLGVPPFQKNPISSPGRPGQLVSSQLAPPDLEAVDAGIHMAVLPVDRQLRVQLHQTEAEAFEGFRLILGDDCF